MGAAWCTRVVAFGLCGDHTVAGRSLAYLDHCLILAPCSCSGRRLVYSGVCVWADTVVSTPLRGAARLAARADGAPGREQRRRAGRRGRRPRDRAGCARAPATRACIPQRGCWLTHSVLAWLGARRQHAARAADALRTVPVRTPLVDHTPVKDKNLKSTQEQSLAGQRTVYV